MDIHRRNFIRQLCFACGSITIIPACTGQYSTWRFLTDKEVRQLISIAEQFIPADEDPGATDAKVINFFDKQLVGYYTRHQETYRKGLQCIDTSAIKTFQKPFEDLKWGQQTSFLEKMEVGELPLEDWEVMSQQSFFRLMLEHTMQGFYGSPRHGGNCNYVSYKMMKIDYPHVIGQNRYPSTNTHSNQKSS
jgi:gluconate 2-dehydrogenase gamma chain